MQEIKNVFEDTKCTNTFFKLCQSKELRRRSVAVVSRFPLPPSLVKWLYENVFDIRFCPQWWMAALALRAVWTTRVPIQIPGTRVRAGRLYTKSKKMPNRKSIFRLLSNWPIDSPSTSWLTTFTEFLTEFCVF